METARSDPEETLIIAAGPRVYAFAHGRPECIAKRPRRVTSLALLDDRVVDSGHYNGVRDTLEGTVVAGGFRSWCRIAEHEGELYGAQRTEDPEQYGIWKVATHELVRKRNGPTRLLASAGRLLDAGEYKRKEDWRWFTRVVDDDGVYDTLEGKCVMGPGYSHDVRDAVLHSDQLFLSNGHWVYEARPDDYISSFSPRYGVKSDISEVHDLFSDLSHKYCYADADHRALWEEFRRLFREHRDAFPKGFGVVREWDDAGERRMKGVEILDLPFDEARDHYSWKFRRSERGLPEGYCLKPVIDHPGMYLFLRHENKYPIQGLALVGEQVCVGTKAGTLEIAERDIQEADEHILWEFSQPVTSLLTVPAEVYEEGIRQKVHSQVRRRAVHAKGVRIPLRFVA